MPNTSKLIFSLVVILAVTCSRKKPDPEPAPSLPLTDTTVAVPKAKPASVDPAEPNDDFNYANEIKPGDNIRLAIHPRGDYDYYKLKITDRATVKFLATGFSGITPEMKLFTLDPRDPEKLQEASGWQKNPASFPIKPGTEYFVAIHDDHDDAASPRLFDLKLE